MFKSPAKALDAQGVAVVVEHLGEGASSINISSNITSLLPGESALYSGTKAAVDAITGVLANELAPRKSRVNAINPGYTQRKQSAKGRIYFIKIDTTPYPEHWLLNVFQVVLDHNERDIQLLHGFSTAEISRQPVQLAP
ncbi:MAG: SDR family oxidoreductase [Pseudomonas sp.]